MPLSIKIFSHKNLESGGLDMIVINRKPDLSSTYSKFIHTLGGTLIFRKACLADEHAISQIVKHSISDFSHCFDVVIFKLSTDWWDTPIGIKVPTWRSSNGRHKIEIKFDICPFIFNNTSIQGFLTYVEVSINMLKSREILFIKTFSKDSFTIKVFVDHPKSPIIATISSGLSKVQSIINDWQQNLIKDKLKDNHEFPLN